jgi:hypothetical protein
MSGEPFPTMMPAILGVRLKGELPDWVSAKDVILEMLRRRGANSTFLKLLQIDRRLLSAPFSVHALLWWNRRHIIGKWL